MYRQLPVFGRLVYSVRAEVTKHDMPGRKSPGCPAAVCAAVGTIWGVNKIGGRNITEYLQPRNTGPREVVLRSKAGSRSHLRWDKADDTVEETGQCAQWDRRGTGSSIQGKILRDTSGNSRWQQGLEYNLQGLFERG